jgi:cell division protein FtsB
MEFDDAQLKTELDQIMARIDAIVKKVDSLDDRTDPDGPLDEGDASRPASRDRQVP